ncbi:MAG: hypothetical protein WEF28_03985 [Acidimicrobiia bacterium]
MNTTQAGVPSMRVARRARDITAFLESVESGAFVVVIVTSIGLPGRYR